ncbi:MAG: L,D-transpeptidase family protein [Planctomycetes bacterium]|nr:L,D-transpeptidase family protein [Planctomycetota bacterium]
MARRSHRPRGRRRTQSWRYIIPVLLIIVVVIAFKYGPFGKNKSTDGTVDITPGANVPELNETEPEVVIGPEPEPLLEPNLPDIATVPDVEPNPEAAELIVEATALLSETPSRIIEARQKLNDVLRMPMNIQQRTFVKDQLSELANKWLLSKIIFPDDKLCGSYLVKSGDLLSTIGKRYKVPWEILKEINKISRPETLQAGEQIKVINGPFHAKVYRSTFTMDLYLQDETFVRSFRVGLGKEETETPTGLWRVKSGGKLIKPPWPDPVTGRMYYPEDPDYPLGSRWIGLEGIKGNAKGRTGFGIHGTIEPKQIGTTGSRGCIRMHNGQVILLYNLLVPGVSTVEVVE